MGEEGILRRMINSSVREANQLNWFVMRCQSAEKIEAYIDEYNANTQVDPTDRVEDLFIPTLAIRKHDDTKNHELRSTLRRFVFLYARPSAFDRLENHLATQYWNIGHTHLSHYVDGSGNAITVSPQKMTTFISGCLEYREKFEIRAKDSQISDGIQVTVREGAFKDLLAKVYNVRYKSTGVRFSIAIPFFANDSYVHIHDCKPEDVRLANQESPVFSDDFIDRIQTSLLAILRLQANKKGRSEMKASDLKHLQQLYYLRHAIIDDELRSIQLDALMSICASLSKKSLEKSKYNRIIKRRLKEVRSQQPSTMQKTALAYLLTALFVSTHDADYRTELKALVLKELPSHAPLRKFLSIIRK